VADLRKRLGDDMQKWVWGDIHTADFVHPLGGRRRHQGAVPRGPGAARRRRLHRHGCHQPERDELEAGVRRVVHVRVRRAGLGPLHRALGAGQLAQPLSPTTRTSPRTGARQALPDGVQPAEGRGSHEAPSRAAAIADPSITAAPAAATRRCARMAVWTSSRSSNRCSRSCSACRAASPTPGRTTTATADLDLYVGFRGQICRLYRNDKGTFVDVAAAVGLADSNEVRVAAWGDYDDDGDPDLFVATRGRPACPTVCIATTGAARRLRMSGGRWA